MWMHKESKWLVRGGRKVRCYLCGKKILKKDPFMFHENTGYYSHNFCIMEANTIDRNERRRAVKWNISGIRRYHANDIPMMNMMVPGISDNLRRRFSLFDIPGIYLGKFMEVRKRSYVYVEA